MPGISYVSRNLDQILHARRDGDGYEAVHFTSIQKVENAKPCGYVRHLNAKTLEAGRRQSLKFQLPEKYGPIRSLSSVRLPWKGFTKGPPDSVLKFRMASCGYSGSCLGSLQGTENQDRAYRDSRVGVTGLHPQSLAGR